MPMVFDKNICSPSKRQQTKNFIGITMWLEQKVTGLDWQGGYFAQIYIDRFGWHSFFQPGRQTQRLEALQPFCVQRRRMAEQNGKRSILEATALILDCLPLDVLQSEKTNKMVESDVFGFFSMWLNHKDEVLNKRWKNQDAHSLSLLAAQSLVDLYENIKGRK